MPVPSLCGEAGRTVTRYGPHISQSWFFEEKHDVGTFGSGTPVEPLLKVPSCTYTQIGAPVHDPYGIGRPTNGAPAATPSTLLLPHSPVHSPLGPAGLHVMNEIASNGYAHTRPCQPAGLIFENIDAGAPHILVWP